MLRLLNTQSRDLNVDSEDDFAYISYSYNVIEHIDSETIKLVYSYPISSCRDSYLMSINQRFKEKDFNGPITSALFVPIAKDADIENIVTKQVKNRLHIHENGWKIPSICALNITTHPIIINGINYLVLIFTIDRTSYKMPLTYWLLTHDIRKAYCSGFSKINESDHEHTSPRYLNLISDLRRPQYYKTKIEPVLNTMNSGLSIQSPAYYLQVLQYLIADIARTAVYKTEPSAQFKVNCELMHNSARLIYDRTSINPLYEDTASLIKHAYRILLPMTKGDKIV